MTRVNYETLKRLDKAINLESRRNLVRAMQLYLANTFNLEKMEWLEMLEIIMQNNFYEAEALDSKSHAAILQTLYAKSNNFKLRNSKYITSTDILVKLIGIIPSVLEIQLEKSAESEKHKHEKAQAEELKTKLGFLNFKSLAIPVGQILLSTTIQMYILWQYHNAFRHSTQLQSKLKTQELLIKLTVWKAIIVIASRYLKDLDDEISEVEKLITSEKETARTKVLNLKQTKDKIIGTMVKCLSEMSAEKQKLIDLADTNAEKEAIEDVFDIETQYKTEPLDERFVDIISCAIDALGTDPTNMNIDTFVDDFIHPANIKKLKLSVLSIYLSQLVPHVFRSVEILTHDNIFKNANTSKPLAMALGQRKKIKQDSTITYAKVIFHGPMILKEMYKAAKIIKKHVEKLHEHKTSINENKAKLIGNIMSAIELHMSLGIILDKVQADITTAEEVKDKFKKGLSSEHEEYRQACYKMYDSILKYLSFKEQLFKAYNEILQNLNIVDTLRINLIREI